MYQRKQNGHNTIAHKRREEENSQNTRASWKDKEEITTIRQKNINLLCIECITGST